MKKRILTVIVALLVICIVFSACSAPAASSAPASSAPASSAAATSAAAASATASGGSADVSIPSSEKELNILCFQGYADDTWVKPFEQKYGVKVNVTYAGTVDEMFTKAKAGGGSQFDIVSIDCGSVQRYYDAGLIQPIDKSKIPDYSKLSSFFQNASYATIGGQLYHSPIVWGANNFVYDKGSLPDFPQSWSVMWDPKYKGQISVTDEANNNVTCTAIGLGFKDPYNLTDDQMNQVQQKLNLIAKNCRTFTTGFDSEKQVMGNGEVKAAISGYDSGLLMYLRDQQHMTVGRMTPQEGIYAWIDGWVMLKGAQHPNLAQAYMSWILSDDTQIALAKSMSFGAVTSAAKAALDPDVVAQTSYDNIDNVKVPVYIMKTPENMEKRVQMWEQAKAAAAQ